MRREQILDARLSVIRTYRSFTSRLADNGRRIRAAHRRARNDGNAATAGPAAEVPSSFAGFLFSGIAHIAGGYDHVLFLLCLLLPAVLQRSDKTRRWVESENLTSALVAVIWIATAFRLRTH